MLAGCAVIPAPRTDLVVPDLRGRVVVDSVPVEGFEVYCHRLLITGACSHSTDSAVTDDEGRFHIPARKRFRFWAVMGDPGNNWGICLQRQGGLVLDWVGRGLGVTATQAEFECELADSPKESKGGVGVCRRVDR